MKYVIFAVVMIAGLALWAFLGAAQQDDHGHEHGSTTSQDSDHGHDQPTGSISELSGDDLPSVAVTQWTPKMELFMEHPVLITGVSGKFIIHLTTLDDFQPVRTGSVKLVFTHESGKTYEVSQDSLLREGIFTPTIELAQAGSYQFTLLYSSPKVKESFEIANFVVYKDAKGIPVLVEHDDEEISFLKEQQWKIDFRTEPVQRRSIRSSLRAVAEVLPQQKGYAELVSPVDGILGVEHNHSLVIPGSKVDKGQILACISPTLQGTDGWTEIRLSFVQAERDYQRAERLKSRNAISQRDFEEMERDYLVKKASHESFAESGETDRFHIRAPISGSVMQMQILPGQKIEAGQKLMTIVDPSTVWLQVNVFETDYYRMSKPTGIYLTIPGRDSGISVGQSGMQLLSVGSAIDPDNRTIPVLLEIANPDLLLKINQSIDVELYSGGIEPALCVPRGAIYDDDAHDIVFVHTGGESFAKRVVEVGAHDDGWVSILTGLEEGERVVTQGGYHVKLASTTTEIGHGHAH